MAKEWKNVIKTTDGQEYVDPCVLSSGPRSTCKAIFFRNYHKSSGKQIVKSLGRRKQEINGLLKKTKQLLLSPKKSIC